MESSDRKTVLVADDDFGILLALERRLSSAGFLVLTASGGLEALEHVREHDVDAVILDVRMPGELDGLAVATVLHKDPETAHIPIIFVTGVTEMMLKQKCKVIGGQYFICKPYDEDVLIRLLNGIFAKDELAELKKIAQAKRRQLVD